jgi:hypothetical protein
VVTAAVDGLEDNTVIPNETSRETVLASNLRRSSDGSLSCGSSTDLSDDAEEAEERSLRADTCKTAPKFVRSLNNVSGNASASARFSTEN